jgi:hypothetical protein
MFNVKLDLLTVYYNVKLKSILLFYFYIFQHFA